MPSNNGNNKSADERRAMSEFLDILSRQVCAFPLTCADTEDIIQRTQTYMDLCSEYAMPPTIAGLAACYGVNTSTVTHWANDDIRGLAPRAMQSIKKVYAQLEAYYAMGIQTGAVNPIGGMFILNNNFGYAQNTQNINIEVKPSATAASLTDKYKNLLPDQVEKCTPDTENSENEQTQ